MAWLALAVLAFAAFATLMALAGGRRPALRVLLLIGWPDSGFPNAEAAVRGLAAALGQVPGDRLAVLTLVQSVQDPEFATVFRALAQEFPGVPFALCPSSDDPSQWAEPLLGGPPDAILSCPAPGDPRPWLAEARRRLRLLRRAGRAGPRPADGASPHQ